MDRELFHYQKLTHIRNKNKETGQKRLITFFKIKPRFLNLYIRTDSNIKVEMTKLINRKRDLIMDLLELFCIDHLYIEIKLHYETASDSSEDLLILELLKMLKNLKLVKNSNMKLYNQMVKINQNNNSHILQLSTDQKRAYFFLVKLGFFYRYALIME